MAADTGATFRRALDFLGLEDDGRQEFPKINEAKRLRIRSLGYVIARGGPLREIVPGPIKKALGVSSLVITRRLKKANTAGTGTMQIDDNLKDEIAEHYTEDGARLAELLGGYLPPRFGMRAPQDRPRASHGSAQESR